MADEKVVGFKITLSGTEKTFKNIKEVKDQLKQVNEELAKTDKGSEDYAKLTEEAGALKAELAGVTKEVKDQQKAFEASKFAAGSYRQLNAELGKLKNAYKELSAEEIASGKISDENVKKYGLTSNSVKDLEQKISGLSNALKATDKRLGDNQRNVGNYASALQGLGKIAASGGGFMAVFAGVNELVDITKDVIASTDEIFKLQGRLQQLGFPTDQVDEFAARITATASTFGKESEDILRAANAFSKQFGVSLGEATSLIEQGFVAGLDANGDFLDLLEEYPVQFKQAGFSAQGFLNVINKQADAGIFSDKGLDLVKEFGLRINEQSKGAQDALEGAFGKQFTDTLFKGINDGSISVQTALSQVATKLDETQLPAKDLANVVKNVFGAQGEDVGIDFIKSLKDIDDSTGTLIDTNNEYEQTQLAVLKANQDLAQSQVELTNLIGGGNSKFEQFSIFLKKVFIDTLIVVIQTFQPLVDVFFEVLEAGDELIETLFGVDNASSDTSASFQFFTGILELARDTLSGVLQTTKFVFNGLAALAGLHKGDLSVGWRLFTSEGQQAARVNKQVESSTKTVTDAFTNETAELNTLFGQLAKTNKNSAERAKVIDELNKKYGEYLPNIDLEVAGQEELQAAYVATTKAIAKAAIEREKAQLKAKAEAELLDAIVKQNLAQEKAIQLSKELAAGNNAVGESIAAVASGLTGGASEYLGLESNVNNLRKALEESNAQFAKQEQIVSDSEKTLAAIDAAADQLANRLSSIYTIDDLKKNVDQNKALNEDLVKQEEEAAKKREAISKLTADQQKKLAEDIRKANEAITELKLSLIDNEFDREIAKIQQQASDRIKNLVGSPEQIATQTSLINQLLEKQINEVNKKRKEAQDKQNEELRKAQEEATRIIREQTLLQQQAALGLDAAATQRITQVVEFDLRVDSAQLQAEFTQQRATLEEELSKGEISYREYSARVIEIEEQRALSQLELEKRAAEERRLLRMLNDTQRINELQLNTEAEKDAILQGESDQLAQLQVSLQNKLLTEEQYEQARIALRQNANAQIALIDEQFRNEQAVVAEETAIANIEAQQRINEQRVAIDQQTNEKLLEQQRNTAQVTGQIIGLSLNFLGEIVSGAKDLLEQDEENREKNAKAIQALAITEVAIRLASELALIAIAAQQAGLATGPAAPITSAIVYGIQAGTAIARAAFSIAKIKSQKTKAESGLAVPSSGGDGVTSIPSPFGNPNIQANSTVSGNLHSQGGEPGLFNGIPIEVERGEYVMRNGPEWYIINRKSSQRFGGLLRKNSKNSSRFSHERRAFASVVNSYQDWGIKFQSGGVLSTSPLSAPNIPVSQETQQITDQFNRLSSLLTTGILSTQEAILSTNERIDNIRVINDPEETSQAATEITNNKIVNNLTIDNSLNS